MTVWVDPSLLSQTWNRNHYNFIFQIIHNYYNHVLTVRHFSNDNGCVLCATHCWKSIFKISSQSRQSFKYNWTHIEYSTKEDLNLGFNFSLAESEIRLCGSGLLLPQVWQLQGFGPHLPLVPLVAGIAKLKAQF